VAIVKLLGFSFQIHEGGVKNEHRYFFRLHDDGERRIFAGG
jgi:hypothetical protein